MLNIANRSGSIPPVTSSVDAGTQTEQVLTKSEEETTTEVQNVVNTQEPLPEDKKSQESQQSSTS